jgi:hypothetical protein
METPVGHDNPAPNETSIIVDDGTPCGVAFRHIKNWSVDSGGALHIYQAWALPTAGPTPRNYDREIATYPHGAWQNVLINQCQNRFCACQGSEPIEHDAFSATELIADGGDPSTPDTVAA